MCFQCCKKYADHYFTQATNVKIFLTLENSVNFTGYGKFTIIHHYLNFSGYILTGSRCGGFTFSVKEESGQIRYNLKPYIVHLDKLIKTISCEWFHLFYLTARKPFGVL